MSPNTPRKVDESKLFTPAEQFELTTMSNDVRSLARFLGSLLLRLSEATSNTNDSHEDNS
jgi:hypothetical protein